MPSSNPMLISKVVREIENIMPETILDIGIGFGKYGFLAREYTDIRFGRYEKRDWTTRIDGIEIFGKYISDIQRNIYSNIYIGDAFELIKKFSGYDLIIFCDVIEHMEYAQGIEILNMLRQKTKYALVATPINVVAQDAYMGNLFEQHISKYSLEVLSKYGSVEMIHDGNGIYLLKIKN